MTVGGGRHQYMVMKSDVSVVTPAFNSAASIERTVRSVASQTFSPKEHIVVDDGSSDDTVRILEQLTREILHLRVIRQHNLGAGAARNAGISAASGRYIAFLDSDDLWLPAKLERQVTFMDAENVQFTYGDFLAVDALTTRGLGVYRMPERLTYHDFLRGCPIGCLTVAFDQRLLGKVYMPDVQRGQDWGLWLGLTRNGAIARRYPGVEAVYSQGGASLSSKKLAKVRDVYRIYREQERVGALRSAYYMIPHIWGSLSKRPEN